MTDAVTARAMRLRDRYAPPRPGHGLDGLATIVLDVEGRGFRIRAAASAILAARRCRAALARQGRPTSGGTAYWLDRAGWNRRHLTPAAVEYPEIREAAE
jgi:hypothetical protein